METYQGIKFKLKQLSATCPDHPLLPALNRWAYLLSELGLTPVHSSGAYGNQSIRVDSQGFIITRTSMTPTKDLVRDNYTFVEKYDDSEQAFITHGIHPPSSESFLHHYIYREDTAIQAILHGHSDLLNQYADQLSIAATDTFHDYGTIELAESALELAGADHNFFILKDHGFVATGDNLEEAGNVVLEHYGRLIALLQLQDAR